MKPSVIVDEHYIEDNRGNKVYTLLTVRNNKQLFSASFTAEELKGIAEAIIKFLEENNL